MTRFVVTWGEYVRSTPEEQRACFKVLIDLWAENAANQIAVDTRFDRSEALEPWLDEYTNIGGDAEQTRHAGKMTATRISSDRRPSNPRYR